MQDCNILKVVAIIALSAVVIVGFVTGQKELEIFYYAIVAVIGAIFGLAVKKNNKT